MYKNLVIVESPTKSKNEVNQILEKITKSLQSVGHIRDLPKSKFGIDIENNFEPPIHK